MNRRSFIQTASRAAAATAAVGALPLGTLAQEPRTRMTINLVCGAIGVEARTQSDINALAVKHGFQSVEAQGGELAGMSRTQIEDLLGSMKQNRIVFGACGLSVDFRGSEEGFQESLRKFKSVAAGLERAGVDRVNTWLSPSSRDLTYIQNFRQHADRLRQVAQLLKDHGQRLGLEYVGTHTLLVRGKYPFVHTLGETRDLIAEIGTGNVGLVLDSWHWWQAGMPGSLARGTGAWGLRWPWGPWPAAVAEPSWPGRPCALVGSIPCRRPRCASWRQLSSCCRCCRLCCSDIRGRFRSGGVGPWGSSPPCWGPALGLPCSKPPCSSCRGRWRCHSWRPLR